MSDPPSTAEDAEAYVQARAAAFLATLDAAGAPVGSKELDYSPASLRQLDNLLADFHSHGATAPPELVVGAGCYLLEVARREHGGGYQTFTAEDPLVLVVRHGAGQVGLLAMSKVRGRVVNGPEDDLPFFYEGFTGAIREGRSATIC
jgi:hypothetical protein